MEIRTSEIESSDLDIRRTRVVYLYRLWVKVPFEKIIQEGDFVNLDLSQFYIKPGFWTICERFGSDSPSI